MYLQAPKFLTLSQRKIIAITVAVTIVDMIKAGAPNVQSGTCKFILHGAQLKYSMATI